MEPRNTREEYKTLIEGLQEARRINPYNSQTIRQLSEAYRDFYKDFRSTKRNEALRALNAEEVLLTEATSPQFYPENSYFIGALANIHIVKDNLKEATRLTDLKLELNKNEFEPVLKLHNDRISYSFKIRIAEKEGNEADVAKYKALKSPIDAELGKLGKARDQDTYNTNIENINDALQQLDGSEALRLTSAMLKQRPKDPVVTTLHSKALLLNGQYAEADRFAANKVMEIVNSKADLTDEMKDRRRASIYLLRAQANYGMGKLDEAKGWLEAVQEVSKDNRAASGLLASIYITQRKYPEAEKQIEAMKQNGDVFALRYESEVHLAKGDISKAVSGFYEFLEKRPNGIVYKKLKELADTNQTDPQVFNHFLHNQVKKGNISEGFAQEMKMPKESYQTYMQALVKKPGIRHDLISNSVKLER